MNERIVSNPKVCGGEPCIKGTRIPVHVILRHIAAAAKEEEEEYGSILTEFPRIKQEDIVACLEYASYLGLREK